MFSASLQAFRRHVFDRLVLRPSRHAIDAGSKSRFTLQWGQNDEELEYFVERTGEGEIAACNAPIDLLVLKFPGTAGRAERSTPFPSDYFSRSHAEVWTWNPPGYGRSSGQARWHRIEQAALAFWQLGIQSEHVSTRTRIWIVGNSLGCVTALHVAASSYADISDRRVGLLLRNPPPLADVVKHVASAYPLGRFIHPVAESLDDTMNAPLTAANVKFPAVLMQSQNDELVLPSLQQKVIDAYAGEKRFVLLEGLTHAGVATEYHESVIRDALAWLWSKTNADD